jgi:hypothetical protein
MGEGCYEKFNRNIHEVIRVATKEGATAENADFAGKGRKSSGW